MLNESQGYGLKIANVQAVNRIVGGLIKRHKWDSVKKTLTTAVKKCKDMDDIKYLRNDRNMAKKTLSKLLTNTEDKDERKKLEEYIKWIEKEYPKMLDERAKELKLKSEETDLLEDILTESAFHMPHNSSHLETIENCIAQIQEGDGSKNAELTRRIQLALNKEFNCSCEGVFIIDNNINNYFFGACIVPTEEECYKIIDNLVRGDENVKFERCSNFIINLDSKLLYDTAATPREITAVLLHEIGHKAFSSLQKVNLKQKLIYGSMDAGIEPSEMKRKFIGCKYVLMTPVINLFTSCFSSIGLIKEIGADSFAIRYGYGRDLSDLISKLLELDKRKHLFRIERKEDEDALLVKWSLDNMINFQMRKLNVLKTLKQQTKGEILAGVSNLVNAQITKLQNTKVSTKGLSISSNFGVKNESFKSFVEMKSKGMSQLELDELEVEIGRIEYHEDKAYLVNRIHKDVLDCEKRINELAKVMKKTGSYSNKIKIDELNAFKKNLNELADRVKKTKIVEKDFEIRVKYPEGYKG